MAAVEDFVVVVAGAVCVYYGWVEEFGDGVGGAVYGVEIYRGAGLVVCCEVFAVGRFDV